VKNLSVEKPRHGLQANVWMRRDVHRLAFRKRQRTESIEKTPRPDEPAVLDRQRAGDSEIP
jgi:hypothetical protein